MEIERLASAEAFGAVGNEVLSALLAHGTEHRLEDGEIIFRVGEPDQNILYIVYDGRVTLTGTDGTSTLYEAVALLGLSSYFDDEPYSLTARATGPCHLIEVPFSAVRRLEREHPALADALSHIIADRIRAGTTQWRTGAVGALSQPVRWAMTAPLVSLPASARLTEAYQLMAARGIGSLGVVDAQDRLIGLATIKSLAQSVLIERQSPDARLSTAAMPARRIPPDAALWQAEEIQAREALKYLVVAENDQPLGMLSQSNIIETIRAHQTLLRDRVARAVTLTDLQALAAELPTVARQAREANREASRAVTQLSEFHIQLQRRCVEMLLTELASEGLGPPPRRYALLIMGSLARRESLLNPDQDNALIIADNRPGETEPSPLDDREQRWFDTFADRLNHRLDALGYDWCQGDIMARTPVWHRQLGEWRQWVMTATRHPNGDRARWANIFLDFELLQGDAGLVDALWRAVLEAVAQHRKLLRFMAADDAEGSPALGLFNRLVTSEREEARGRVDIKRNGMRILANGCRIYALGHQVRATGTLARLQALRHHGVLTPDKVDSLVAAQEALLGLLLDHQLRQWGEGRRPDKYIAPDRLDEMQRQALVTSLRAIRRFQDRVQGVFGL